MRAIIPPRLPAGRVRVDMTPPSVRMQQKLRQAAQQQVQQSRRKGRGGGGGDASIMINAASGRPHTTGARPGLLISGDDEFSINRQEMRGSDDDEEDDVDFDDANNQEDYVMHAGAGSLQERILQAKVAELEEKLRVATKEREGLVASLKTSINSHEATKARLASVTELLTSQVFPPALVASPNQQHHHHHRALSAGHQHNQNQLAFLTQNQQQKRFTDKSTQAPDIVDDSVFAGELEQRQGLYHKDIRGALLSLLDRHEDVKDLLLRNSWLLRNKEYTERFPSFTRPLTNVAIEAVDGRIPPTAETIVAAREIPQSHLRSELREMARRSNPITRYQKKPQQK